MTSAVLKTFPVSGHDSKLFFTGTVLPESPGESLLPGLLLRLQWPNLNRLWLNLSWHHICPLNSMILTSLHPDSSSSRPMSILPSWMSVNRSCTSIGGSRWGEKAWPSLMTTFFSVWSDELICALLSAETHSSTWWRFSSALLFVHLRKRKQGLGLGTPIFK